MSCWLLSLGEKGEILDNESVQISRALVPSVSGLTCTLDEKRDQECRDLDLGAKFPILRERVV